MKRVWALLCIGAAFAQTRDPAAWGGDHAGKAAGEWLSSRSSAAAKRGMIPDLEMTGEPPPLKGGPFGEGGVMPEVPDLDTRLAANADGPQTIPAPPLPKEAELAAQQEALRSTGDEGRGMGFRSPSPSNAPETATLPAPPMTNAELMGGKIHGHPGLPQDLENAHLPNHGPEQELIDMRRGLNAESAHMNNRSAVVSRLLDVIPPETHPDWVLGMSPKQRIDLADFVGAEASDETWGALADALAKREGLPSGNFMATAPATGRMPPELDYVKTSSGVAQWAKDRPEVRDAILKFTAPNDSAEAGAQISHLMQDAPRFKGDVWRGSKDKGQFNSSTYTATRDWSASIDKDRALHFMEHASTTPDVLIKIEQESGIPLAGLSAVPAEKEVLLPSGSRYRVISNIEPTDEEGIRHVVLRELPPLPQNKPMPGPLLPPPMPEPAIPGKFPEVGAAFARGNAEPVPMAGYGPPTQGTFPETGAPFKPSFGTPNPDAATIGESISAAPTTESGVGSAAAKKQWGGFLSRIGGCVTRYGARHAIGSVVGGGPFGAAAYAGGLTISELMARARGGDAMGRLASRSTTYAESALKSALSYGSKLPSSTYAVPGAIKSFMSGAKTPEAAFDKRMAELQNLSANNGQVMIDKVADAFGPLAHTEQPAVLAVTQAAQRGVDYLLQTAPKTKPDDQSLTPITDSTKPARADINEWARVYSAVMHPMTVLQDIRTGVVVADQIQAVKTVYPTFYEQQIVDPLNSMLRERDMKKQPLLPQERRVADIVLGSHSGTDNNDFVLKYGPLFDQALSSGPGGQSTAPKQTGRKLKGPSSIAASTQTQTSTMLGNIK